MLPVLFSHPFAAYCQKVLIALYDNATPFTYRYLTPEDPEAMVELERLWPLKRFPVLVDDGHTFIEASIIIDYLDNAYPGAVKLIPDAIDAALDVRFMDRFFDNYVMTPQGRMVADALLQPDERSPRSVSDARSALEEAYGWLDTRMAGRQWASGDSFSLADCAAGPALFYADWSHAIPERYENVRRYRERLVSRPSFARVIDEARPYRSLFPLGAPDRD